MGKWLRIVCALAAVLIAGNAAAQETRGTISGTVRDKDGVLPGANVTITNTGTSVSQQLVTNGSGYFEAPLLIARAYEVSVEQFATQGFVGGPSSQAGPIGGVGAAEYTSDGATNAGNLITALFAARRYSGINHGNR
jgi:hypothetical protein